MDATLKRPLNTPLLGLLMIVEVLADTMTKIAAVACQIHLGNIAY
jgi:hypothetical protein